MLILTYPRFPFATLRQLESRRGILTIHARVWFILIFSWFSGKPTSSILAESDAILESILLCSVKVCVNLLYRWFARRGISFRTKNSNLEISPPSKSPDPTVDLFHKCKVRMHFDVVVNYKQYERNEQTHVSWQYHTEHSNMEKNVNFNVHLGCV